MKEAIQKDSSSCLKIYEVRRLADMGFYQTIYRNDITTFNTAFNICLKIDEESYDVFMEKNNKREKEHLASLPQIDSAHIDEELIISLKEIKENDQEYRKKLGQLNVTESEKLKYKSKQNEIDSINLIKVDSILNHKGYPQSETVGYPLSQVAFLILHHQSDINIRMKYRPIIEKNCPPNKLRLYDQYTDMMTINN